jgi:hypothetical protein
MSSIEGAFYSPWYKDVKRIAKYITDKIRSEFFFFSSLLSSFITITLTKLATLAINPTLSGVIEQAIEIATFIIIVLLLIYPLIGGIGASATLILRVPFEVKWEEVFKQVLGLQTYRLSQKAGSYGFEVKERPEVGDIRVVSDKTARYVKALLSYGKAIPYTLEMSALHTSGRVVLAMTVNVWRRAFFSFPKEIIKGRCKKFRRELRRLMRGRSEPLFLVDVWHDVYEDLALFLDDLLADLKDHEIVLEETVP